jgi:hypothetical protein
MRSSVRAIALAVVLAAIGVFTAAWSAIWLTRGSFVTALLILGVAVWGFGFAAYFLCTASGATHPRAETDNAGTLLRPGRYVDTVFVVSTVAITVVAALYLVLSPLGLVDYVPTGVMRVGVPVGCGALVLFGMPTLYRMAKYRGGAHLRLDPTGFEVWNGQWGSFRRGVWGDVKQISDHPPRGRKPFNDVIVFVLPKGPVAMLVADTVSADSRALLEWVQFYWHHPECRDELVDDRGLRRLENMSGNS